jgi:hypothetical protein
LLSGLRRRQRRYNSIDSNYDADINKEESGVPGLRRYRNGERVPIQNLTLYIGSDTCAFQLDGTELSGDLCQNITITKDSDGVPYGYGNNSFMYGYGYGYNVTAMQYGNYNATFGAGYGYGYSASVASELVYNITWTTPAVSADTSYSVRLDAYASNNGIPYIYTGSESSFFTVKNSAPLTIATGTQITGGGSYTNNTWLTSL